MVLIIDGEIVQDNDPRAIARRNPKPAASQPAGRGPNIHSVGVGGGVGGGGGGGGGGAGGAGGGPLDQIADALGIRGRTVEIPAISRLPARQVQQIHLLILAALTLFLGWQVLAVAVLLHVVSGLSEQPGAAGAPAGRAAPRAPGGGGSPGAR